MTHQLKNASDLRALFVDFNSYFASVEQQEQPALRGRPTAVVPVMTENTCVIAASYEAKRLGVKTGTRVGDARKMCPELILVEGRSDIYVDYHHRLIAAVDSCLPVSEILSIDEMCCTLLGPWRAREKALATAREIKAKIAQSVGAFLRCSIGIAPNPFLAKLATDMQKPDGLVLLEKKDLPGRLFTLKLRDIVGVGQAMEARLHRCNIFSVEQLCLAPKETLHHAWGGIEGERMHALLRGDDIHRAPTQRRTVGHSHVLEPTLRTRPLAEAVLHRLLHKASARLRALGYFAARLAVGVKFLNDKSWGEEMEFLETQETLDFIRVFNLLWRRYPAQAPPPLLVSITLCDLANHTTGRLNCLGPSRHALDLAVDRLNQSYGKNTVYFGGAQLALDSAPTRIAFTHIPSRLEIEAA